MENGIVSTISDRCKRCYSCIRECPAKAIKVVNGQAQVIEERCIACGHCVTVCSQDAKQIKNDVDFVLNEILPFHKTIAVVAPSFAASFPDNFRQIPNALRALGFIKVIETAFGADLISDLYYQEIQAEERKTIISSPCPAVVNFIEKYYGELVPNLARIVSPMIAIGRYMRDTMGDDIKIVFIGPCIAKKHEMNDEEVSGVIDAVLTFSELKEIFNLKQILFEEISEGEFDPPHAFIGKTYPLAGGLLKTADVSDDILEKNIIVVEGKKKVIELIDEISANEINSKFVDILFCEGCISGPAIDSKLNYYSRREKVIRYIEESLHTTDKQVWKSNLYNARKLNFTRSFSVKNQRKPYPDEEKIKEILAQTNKHTIKDELNCGACGYSTCREYAVAIAKGLAETDMCLPNLIDQLNKAYSDLSNTQEQLRIAEKLASIGQLAAGVAHEINNPLGTILLYASMLKKELEKRFENDSTGEDLELIVEEANRCRNIVSNLLNFARQGKLNLGKVNLVKLINGIIKTVQIRPQNSKLVITKIFETDKATFYCDEEQLKQVFLNLINNACEAMEETEKKELTIKLKDDEEFAVIEITDTGCGIPKENFSKIFTPFFTTKKIGKGTGLGLAISYGIVKMHRGHITLNSEPGKGTTFKIKIPKNLIPVPEAVSN